MIGHEIRQMLLSLTLSCYGRAGKQATVDRLGRRFLRIVLLHIGPASHAVRTRPERTCSHQRIPRIKLLYRDVRE